jgi:hypothetical protein
LRVLLEIRKRPVDAAQHEFGVGQGGARGIAHAAHLLDVAGIGRNETGY